ncbi:hypothetical protein GJ697_19075 [Pseudoduganella sp. FT25W]|uniref:Serine protease n=1 Tax=Duganella alba TaxID=2666081 RepID=A0A6L5QJV0_9BURK|nr:hypothetical protein [Duganella alba]MRX09945.1 hypothetical protein [Duganella alba]MRX17582.1 hypothetical protein [Duganella alba]
MKPDLILSQVQQFGLDSLALQQLMEDHEALVQRYLATPGSNVVGVSVALNPDANASRSDRLALKLSLKHKDGIAYDLRSPQHHWPLITEVTGEIFAKGGRAAEAPEPQESLAAGEGFRNKNRPVLGGISGGPVGGDTGTIGCQVKATVKGKETVYMLSNNHVLADSDALPLGTAIIQPGKADGGVASDAVASLSCFVPLGANGGTAEVDAAIAAYTKSDLYIPLIRSAVDSAVSMAGPVVAPTLDMVVRKSGRTTGRTRGTVYEIGGTYTVNYAEPGDPPRTIIIKNAFKIRPDSGHFSEGGDSGSVITTGDLNQPVGLLLGGPSDCSYTLANTMSAVLANLEAVMPGNPKFVVLYS